MNGRKRITLLCERTSGTNTRKWWPVRPERSQLGHSTLSLASVSQDSWRDKGADCWKLITFAIDRCNWLKWDVKRFSKWNLDRKHSFLKEPHVYVRRFYGLVNPWNWDWYYSLKVHFESCAKFQRNFHHLSAKLHISSQANFTFTTIKILFSSLFHLTTF